MATLLTDAAIRIALDPRAAKEELDKLSKEIDDIDKEKQEQARDLDQLEQRAKDQGTAFRRANSSTPGAASGTGLVDQIKRAVEPYVAMARTGMYVGEKVLPQLGTALREGTDGTILGPFARDVDDKIQALAQKISTLESYIEKAYPTVEQAIQYNIAALRLGGRFPEDQSELFKALWTVNTNQEELRRNLERDINNGTIKTIFDAAKAFVAGGR